LQQSTLNSLAEWDGTIRERSNKGQVVHKVLETLIKDSMEQSPKLLFFS